MKTFEADPRFDEAFERWYASLSPTALSWMEAHYADTVLSWHDGPAQHNTRTEGADVLAHWVVREALREVWELRERAAAEDSDLVERALRGALQVSVGQVGPVRHLAKAVKDGDVAALPRAIRTIIEPRFPNYRWDRPECAIGPADGFGQPFELARLFFLAGRVFRDAGALEDAYSAYTWGRSAWGYGWPVGNSDDGIHVERFGWRWGLPSYSQDQVLRSYDVQRIPQMNWAKYDHVIGCGTSIRHRTLDLLAVPRWKQHIVEVHSWIPRVPDWHFPRLSGRVAVVDDVHEGQTSTTLARLYDGDVVSVATGGLVGRERPVCIVENALVTADVQRPASDDRESVLHRPRPRLGMEVMGVG